jgi:hypothetical protein
MTSTKTKIPDSCRRNSSVTGEEVGAFDPSRRRVLFQVFFHSFTVADHAREIHAKS